MEFSNENSSMCLSGSFAYRVGDSLQWGKGHQFPLLTICFLFVLRPWTLTWGSHELLPCCLADMCFPSWRFSVSTWALIQDELTELPLPLPWASLLSAYQGPTSPKDTRNPPIYSWPWRLPWQVYLPISQQSVLKSLHLHYLHDEAHSRGWRSLRSVCLAAFLLDSRIL